MTVKELKEILDKRKDDDRVLLHCHNNKAELILYYGRGKRTEKVIMKDHDLWHS